MTLPPLDRYAYTIGWICAEEASMTAAIAMLDQAHELLQPSRGYGDYRLGSIGPFNIVICYLSGNPSGIQSESASVAKLLAMFPNLRIGINVGIGSGVANERNDIRLGDVVVSLPTKERTGLLGYYTAINGKFGVWPRWRSLIEPPSEVKKAASKSSSPHQIHDKIQSHLSETLEHHPALSPNFTRPDCEDILYEPEPQYPGSFELCKSIARQARQPYELIKVHYGSIASADPLEGPPARSRQRDEISKRLGGVLCFGRTDSVPIGALSSEGLHCVMIRGICDYADIHTTSEWQEYSAGVAAAFAKEFIVTLPTTINKYRIGDDVQETSVGKLGTDDPEQVRKLDTGPHWLIPLRDHSSLSLRWNKFSVLRQWLVSEDSYRPMVISGFDPLDLEYITPLQFAYQAKEHLPGLSVFWVEAPDQLVFEHGYKQISQLLKIPNSDDDAEDIKQLVRDALSNNIDVGPWLIIISDVQDIGMVFQQRNKEQHSRI